MGPSRIFFFFRILKPFFSYGGRIRLVLYSPKFRIGSWGVGGDITRISEVNTRNSFKKSKLIQVTCSELSQHYYQYLFKN